jgi:hypothetical protein
MTEADLYAMGQESPTAFYLMRELCKAFDLPYPPKQQAPDTSRRDALPDPLK